MKLLRKLKKILHLQTTIHDTVVNCVDTQRKIDELTNCAKTSFERGVSDSAICDEEVVVSLTSFGERIYDVYLSIESIMQGTIKPNRIVLWLAEDSRSIELPIVLKKQMSRGLEIRYCKDIRSYKKLIFALKEFPNSTIITIDDDILYPYDFLENMINTHKCFPHMLCSNCVHPIKPDYIYNNVPCSKWDVVTEHFTILDKFIAEGYTGILYPPQSLDIEVFSEDVFMDICKYADDIWFSAMAIKNNTKCVYSYPHAGFFKYVENPNVQSTALKNINRSGASLNTVQLKNVFQKYGLC